MKTVVTSLSVLAALVSLSATAQDIGRGDPHLPAPPPPPEAMIRVDDMQLFPEQLQQLLAPERTRAQAHVLDYRATLGPWDAGVVPYEFSPEFSAAERQRILDNMAVWQQTAPLLFVARTTQTGYLSITRETDPAQTSPCFSNVGQFRRGVVVRLNLGAACLTSNRNPSHELGHAIGLLHEHQRADRDAYVSVDMANVAANARSNFDKYSFPLIGPYDFLSVMHYRGNAFAADASRPSMTPAAGYESFTATMGTAAQPSQTDHDVTALLYSFELRDPGPLVYGEPRRTTFQRADLLLAMERLHAFYMSRYGLQRAQGLSIDGRPDLLGIAQWIFEIYIPARSAGILPDLAMDYVRAAITQSAEWRQKNPARRALTPPPPFSAFVRLDRDEYLSVLQRLDRFYSAPEGLQRPQGLSIAGGPDFLGIATWIFDVYLNERLRGTSPNGAWTLVENAITATDEWRRKH